MKRSRAGWAAGLVLAATGAVGSGAAAQPAPAASDAISESETALFMSNHLAGVHPPTTLRYTVHKAGSLEAGFDDALRLDLGPRDGQGSACCSARASFVAMPQRQPTLEVDSAEGNPVIQYFLEHDIAGMHRLTGGSTSYFRKLIRLSLASNATLRPVSFDYRGQRVAGREIDIAPYVDDPNRGRYPKLVGKRYLFLLSDQVPGGVYGIATRVSADRAGSPPLLVEEMMIEGAGRQAGTGTGPDKTPSTQPDSTKK